MVLVLSVSGARTRPARREYEYEHHLIEHEHESHAISTKDVHESVKKVQLQNAFVRDVLTSQRRQSAPIIHSYNSTHRDHEPTGCRSCRSLLSAISILLEASTAAGNRKMAPSKRCRKGMPRYSKISGERRQPPEDQ